jgi:hypothetical protein
VNRLHELFHKHGQSLWLDNIRRGMLTGGELRGLIADGLRGMTSNPTIFEKAISSGAEYDEPIRRLLAAKKNVAQIFDALAIEDVQGAADCSAPCTTPPKGPTASFRSKSRPSTRATQKPPSPKPTAFGKPSIAPTRW